MCSTNVLTIIALVLNFLALIVVTIQTILTRNALDAARDSIESSRKARQMEILPRASFIITVQNDLRQWKTEFQTTITTLEEISARQDAAALHAIALQGLTSPKGLVNRHMYERSPNWLSVIWVTGAQYYYNAKAPQRELWRDNTNQPNFNFIDMMIVRYRDSITGLTSLLSYINDIVPEAYLESPASIGDDAFLSD